MDPRNTPQLLLDTWFGEITPEGLPSEKRRITRWFNSTPEFDQQLRWLFEKDLRLAAEKMAPLWQEDAHQWLAYILLMDQVPRNIFRSTANAFAYDARALEACLEGTKKSLDQGLALCEKVFFYMPLQHSEASEHQQESIKAYSTLVDEAQGEQAKAFAQKALESAKTHQRIIQQFKRFPHRNILLGRENTPAEEWFLNTTQNRFGQNA